MSIAKISLYLYRIYIVLFILNISMVVYSYYMLPITIAQIFMLGALWSAFGVFWNYLWKNKG